MSKIGEILIEKNIITLGELNMALDEQRKTNEPLGKLLVRLKLVTEEQFLIALAGQMSMKFYPKLSDLTIDEEIIKKVPVKLVGHYKFMPISLEGNTLTIAISDPFNMWLTEGIKTSLNMQIKRILAPEKEILEMVKKYYGVASETVEKILGTDAAQKEVAFTLKEAQQVEDLETSTENASVIRLVNQILAEAIQKRATDIHLEPYRGSIRIRQRIDGILYNISLPEQTKLLFSAMISRIKIISGLNVVERRLPQDGRAKVKIKDNEIDLRTSVIPSAHGENVVIRLLPAQRVFSLNDLGFLPDDLDILRKIITKPHGIIFLTGPTGSGKTTTLYAALSEINSPRVKITTIEDPVEYELEGVTQIQTNPKIGLNFAAALRSILRHDPDIMMVGEVRDNETAELAIRSSLTGHLVFSTLHTNDAASGVTRLLDMGVEPYLVASSVEVLISQRLVRMICPKCKYEVPTPKIENSTFDIGDVTFLGKGCEACNSTGFHGRSVIYEMLIMNDELRELVTNKQSVSVIQNKAQELGMKTMRENGLEKIRAGITTIDEIMRVVEL